MILNPKSNFTVTLLEDDPRTGWKKGLVLYPKGVYFNGKNVIVVGCRLNNNTVRVALSQKIVRVEVE